MKLLTSLLLCSLLFFSIDSHAQRNKKSCSLDTDKDGIADCFDLCMDSLNNERVDSHGCPRDTDGDGIADYKDFQLITPTDCLPVDSNGIGDCPCNCPEKYKGILDPGFTHRKINFDNGTLKFNDKVASFLDNLITEMLAMPNFRVQIILQGSIKQQSHAVLLQQQCKKYLLAKDIDEERLIFVTGITANIPYMEISNP